MQTENKNINS
jgi:hypothetical protein